MARPRESLVERCREGSFRPRHHWRLLAEEPELPVPELGELQRRARGSDEDGQRELARVFAQRLRGLTEAQAERLAAERRLGCDGACEQEPESFVEQEPESLVEQEPEGLVELEAALAELVARVRLELTAGERFRASLLRQSVRELAAIEAQIECEGLTVAGSRGQRRPHPLLVQAAALRRDLDSRYRRFELDVKLRAQFDRAQAGFFERQRLAAAGLDAEAVARAFEDLKGQAASSTGERADNRRDSTHPDESRPR